MSIAVHELSVRIDGSDIVSDVGLLAARGQMCGLIGPNGSGKSTLLRCIYRALKPVSGAVLIDGDDVRKLGAKATGKRVAVVAQDHDLDNDYSVTETVAMGRTPHKRLLDRDGAGDRRLVSEALDRVGMGWADQRTFQSLSGGERQRVLVARALAQQTSALLLDEPTNHLDVRAQLELLELVAELGLTTIAALHDLDHAAAYCDQLVMLAAGRVVASGPPTDVLDDGLVGEVFGVRSAVVAHPLTGRPHVVTAPRHPDARHTGHRQEKAPGR